MPRPPRHAVGEIAALSVAARVSFGAIIAMVLPDAAKSYVLPPANCASPKITIERNTAQKTRQTHGDKSRRHRDRDVKVIHIFYFVLYKSSLLILFRSKVDDEEYRSKMDHVFVATRAKIPWFYKDSGKHEAGRVLYVQQATRRRAHAHDGRQPRIL